MQDVQEGAHPKEKKSAAGQFAAVKYKLEKYCWTQKLNREDYRVDKYWGTSCCCERANTVEKQ